MANPAPNSLAIGPSGSGAYGVNPNANWNATTGQYTMPSSIFPTKIPTDANGKPIPGVNWIQTSPGNYVDNTAKPTAIISGKEGADYLNNVQDTVNNLNTGIATQSAAKAAQQAATPPTTPTSPATGTSGTTAPATPTADNSDLTKSLNAATTALGGETPTTPEITPEQAQIDANNKALTDDQLTRDTSTQKFNDTVDSLTNGTFPLTPTQQGLLNQTQSAVQNLIASANTQAQLYQQAGVTFGAVHGLAQFAPGLALQAISEGMAKGQAEIAKAEMDGTKALADLQKSFQDEDYNMVQKSYDALQSALDKKDTLLNKLNTDIQKQVTDAKTQQDKTQDNARLALNSILTQLGGQAFDNLTPEQQAQMDALEKAAGWPVGMVKAGMDTLAEQKAQATSDLAKQRLTDQEAQQKIANAFKEAALAQGQQRINISIDKAALGGVGGSDTGRAVGTTGDNKIDMTQPGYFTDVVVGTTKDGLTQAAIDQDAMATALGQPLPVPLGLSNSGTASEKRSAINNRMAEINSSGNVASNKAQLKSLNTALTQQTTQMAAVQKALVAADNGVNQIIEQFKSKGINNFSLPISNIIANAAKYQLGSGDVSAYKGALQEISNEYSQVFARSGTQTDMTRTNAQNIIDGNVSIDNLQKISAELQAQGKIVTDSNAGQIQAIQKNINGIISGDTSNENTSGQTTTPTSTAGKIKVVAPDGKTTGYIPAGRLQDYIKQGYKQY